jgi:hypothetical protein
MNFVDIILAILLSIGTLVALILGVFLRYQTLKVRKKPFEKTIVIAELEAFKRTQSINVRRGNHHKTSMNMPKTAATLEFNFETTSKYESANCYI